MEGQMLLMNHGGPGEGVLQLAAPAAFDQLLLPSAGMAVVTGEEGENLMHCQSSWQQFPTWMSAACRASDNHSSTIAAASPSYFLPMTCAAPPQIMNVDVTRVKDWNMIADSCTQLATGDPDDDDHSNNQHRHLLHLLENLQCYTGTRSSSSSGTVSDYGSCQDCAISSGGADGYGDRLSVMDSPWSADFSRREGGACGSPLEHPLAICAGTCAGSVDNCCDQRSADQRSARGGDSDGEGGGGGGGEGGGEMSEYYEERMKSGPRVELEEEDVLIHAEVDRKRLRRMLSNRESARRSRQRKQEHLDSLEVQVARLRVENAALVRQANEVARQFDERSRENYQLKRELSSLRGHMADLLNAAVHMRAESDRHGPAATTSSWSSKSEEIMDGGGDLCSEMNPILSNKVRLLSVNDSHSSAELLCLMEADITHSHCTASRLKLSN